METTPGNGSRQGAAGGQTGSATSQGSARGGQAESSRTASGAPQSGAQTTPTQQGSRGMTSQQSGRGAGTPTQGGSMQGGMPMARGGQGPFGMMMQLSREMDRLMDSFFNRSFGGFGGFGTPFGRSLFGESGQSGGTTGEMAGGMRSPMLWSPQVEVNQRGDSLVVHADLPGLRREDVHLECTDEGLVIHGERRDERQSGDERQGSRFTERSYGSFYRLIPLPEGANTEAAKASMKDGVLEVTIPVPKKPGGRKIEIEG